jgi:hypothetical protein
MSALLIHLSYHYCDAFRNSRAVQKSLTSMGGIGDSRLAVARLRLGRLSFVRRELCMRICVTMDGRQMNIVNRGGLLVLLFVPQLSLPKRRLKLRSVEKVSALTWSGVVLLRLLMRSVRV